MGNFKQAFLITCVLLQSVATVHAQCAPGPGVEVVPKVAERPYVAGQQGPSGGVGGGYCRTNEIEPFWRLATVSANSGNSIDALDLTFEIPAPPGGALRTVKVHCGGGGGTLDSGPAKCADRPAGACGILTLAADEQIVRVLGHYGEVVDNLYVQTSKGKFRYFGNQHSRATGVFDYIAPTGTFVSALVVRCDDLVDAVGVVLRPNQ